MKTLTLLDEIMANDYKEKIIHLLRPSAYWYELAEKRIFSELSMMGQLMAIYLLPNRPHPILFLAYYLEWLLK